MIEKVGFKNVSPLNNDLKKKREELFQCYLQDKEFYDFLKTFNLSDETIHKNVGILQDFYNEFHICRDCHDLNNCKMDDKYMNRHIVASDEDTITFDFGYCNAYLSYKNKMDRILINDLNPEYIKKQFDELDVNSIRVSFIKDLASLLIKGTLENNLFFVYGEPNSGNTFISNVFFKTYLEKYDVNGIYADGFTRISELNDLLFSNKNSFQDLLSTYQKVDVLVINKVSSAYINEFIRDNIIYPIISERLKNNKITILTSELTLDDFTKLMYGKTIQSSIRAKQIKNLLLKFKQFDITTKLNKY